jgi:ABC-2 type transport system permease protein
MVKKNLRKRNILQLIVVFIAILVINFAGSFIVLRADLTAEGRYTLSDKTRSLLKETDDHIFIKIYLDGDDLPVGFKRMRRALGDMLEVFNYYAAGEMSYKYINPGQLPDQKARFGLYKELYDKGIVPIESQEVTEEGKTSQKMVFPAVVVVYKGKDIGVNLLKNDPRFQVDSDENINNSIQSLEYELTNAIRKLSQPKKPEIAFIEGHGELDEYQAMDISTSLSEYYEVKRGEINQTPGILDPFAAIIIAKPSKIYTETDKLIIDQYIMKGGKVLWLLEGASITMDSLRKLPTTVAMPMENNLSDLLFRYGVRLNPGLMQDMQCSPIGLARQGMDNRPRIDLFPWPFNPVILSSNTHEINKYLNLIRLEFAASLDTVASSPGVKKTILLHSSNKARFDYAPLQVSIENVQAMNQQSKYTAKALPVAVLMEGAFESNFKNRMLDNLVIPANQLIHQSKPTKMIVVADGDIAVNAVSAKGEIYPIGFDVNEKRAYQGNKEFLINALNYLTDDEGLMSVRLREIKMRLLNKDKLLKEKTFWKTLNTLLPVILIVLVALMAYYIRRRKYGSNW